MINLFDKALHHLGRTGKKPFIVQVGAMDGVSFDHGVGYIDMYNWNGLYIEPITENFAKLLINKGGNPFNRFENVAITSIEGPVEMIRIDQAAIDSKLVHPCFEGMASINPPKNGLASEGDRETVEKYGKTIVVEGLRLQTVLDKHGVTDIGVFLVDTEGYDWYVFEQLDLSRYKPTLIRLEHVNLTEEQIEMVQQKFRDNGYIYEKGEQDIDAVPTEFYMTYLDGEKASTTKTATVTEQASVSVSPSQPTKSNTTLVTALFNLRRGDLDTGFKRPYSQYLEHFGKLLEACKEIPMIIYVDESDVEFVNLHREGSVGTDIRLKKAEDFRTWFAFYDKVQKIRTNPDWYNQAGWLADSTQAKLDLYNPLVMSKMFLLNDAALFDPFGTDNFAWIDAGLTQTVHPGYFSKDNVIQKIEPMFDKFLFICFPYIGSNEIHGFERKAIARYAGVDYVDRVARGGFFGGCKSVLHEVNNAYYHTLMGSLNEGLMGTEESIFSILTYTQAERVRVEMINDNGLIGTFFERVKNLPPPPPKTVAITSTSSEVVYRQTAEEVEMNKTGTGTSLYIVTFNFPKQLQTLLDTIEESNPELLKVNRLVLIDNSTDKSTIDEYDAIVEKYKFELIRRGNMGICGARQWAAEDFHESKTKYMVWFEDDMLLVPSNEHKICRNGLNMHIDNFLGKCIKVLNTESVDFVKFSFSEFYGDHHKQWSWHNVPAHVKKIYFPDGKHRMKWEYSGCIDGMSYLIGDVYYSNWPSVMTRRGNYKIFIETKYAAPFEQTIMSHAFQLTKKGELRSAVLMSSLINHNRTHHYQKEIRKEV